MLDIGIGDDTVFSVADILSANNVPIVFSSGYEKDALPDRYRDRPLLAKPYLIDDVVRALVAAMNPAKDPGDRARLDGGGATEDGHASRPDGLHQHQDARSAVRPSGDHDQR